MHITASKLYDYLQCPHKVWRDLYGPQDEKIMEANPFVQMLWEKGVAHEERVVRSFGEIVDVKSGTQEERFKQTMQAIKEGFSIIYQGVLIFDNCVGIPDLLQRMPDGKYVPIDIKSGMAMEGVEDEEGESRQKKTYAVQLCLYTELLQKLDIPNTGYGTIIDIRRNEVPYDFHMKMGNRSPMTWWEFYEQTKNNVAVLLANKAQNKPAMTGACKLCVWYQSCKRWCKENDDLTQIFYLGRSKRDVINEDLGIEKVSDICELDCDELLEKKKKDKSFLKGIGKETLNKLKTRAIIVSKTKQPVVYQQINFPKVSVELFFDIEDDPTQEFVYMHGVYERRGSQERFLDFTATDNTEEAEKEAWQRFWGYIRSLPVDDYSVYYYSHHEKTTYRKMQKLYADVVSAEEVEDFFGHSNTVDLFDIVKRHTDWPLGSYSLKEIAQFLGFKWRDETPSGALSIQWFNEYLKDKDPKKLERILLYNEDDCKATMVIKDAIESMSPVKLGLEMEKVE